MNENTITVAGNVVSDVKSAVTTNGHCVSRFRMVSQQRRFDRRAERWVELEPTFFTVVCWRNLAGNVVSSVHKGDPVVVSGKLNVREWERDDRRGTAVEIDASVIGHNLVLGQSTFTKRTAGSAATAGESAVA